MESRGSQGGGDKLPAILMVVSFISIGGFLFWLNVKAQPEEVAIVEISASDSLAATAVIVQAAVLGADPMAQAGQLIRVEDVPVAGNVGLRAFWTDMPNHPGPYLVHLDSTVVADSVLVNPGDQVTLVGNVLQMSDSVADAWEATGAISENQKFEVTFAESFLEIMNLMVTRGARGGGAN